MRLIFLRIHFFALNRFCLVCSDTFYATEHPTMHHKAFAWLNYG